MMPDRAPDDESAGSSRYSDSSATFVYNRQNASCIVAFEDGEISGNEIIDPQPFRYPRVRKYSSPQPPSRDIAKERTQSISPPQLSRNSSNFGQPLVQKQGITGPSRQMEESKKHQTLHRSSPLPSKSTARVQYPSVPDMSRPRTSSPDLRSPQHRDTRPQPQPHYGQPSNHRHTAGNKRPLRDSWDCSPSPPYPPSPIETRTRDDYSPNTWEMEDEFEDLRFTQQREQKEALYQKYAKEVSKMLLDERKAAREEAKKEFEQARLEAEKVVCDRLDVDRKVEEAILHREAEQTKRIESTIKLRLETERQAEEREKRVRDRMEEDLEVLMKTRMAEEFDNLMETARERLGILKLSSPIQADLRRFKARGKSDHRGSGIYAIGEAGMDYSEQPSQPRPSNSAGRSFATSSNKPGEYILSPSEYEWERTLRHVPETVPQPLSFNSGSEGEEIQNPHFPRKPRWHEPYGGASPECRGRARHCSRLGDKTHSVHQTILSPGLVQQIAHAVVGILRGPECNDFVSHQPNHIATPRHSFSRTTDNTPDRNGCCCRGDHGMVNRVQTNDREERQRRQHTVKGADASRSSDNGFQSLPSLSGSRGSPIDENNLVVTDMIHPDPIKNGLSQSNNEHVCAGESQVKMSVLEAEGPSGDVANHAWYRDGACIGLTSSESVTRVDSEISAPGFKIERNFAPFPIQELEPNKEAGLKKGCKRLKRRGNFVIED